MSIYAVRSQKDTWLRLWFESISISPGFFVLVALKDSSGRIKMNWNLTSNNLGRARNFDSMKKGDWFEIKQAANVSFDLRFMSYMLPVSTNIVYYFLIVKMLVLP